jgi:membrane protein
MTKLLEWTGVQDFPLLEALLRAASLLMSLLVPWLLFTWMIARLPRELISFASSMRAGVIAAVGFELFRPRPGNSSSISVRWKMRWVSVST